MPHQSFASCIQACYDCATACNHCASSCLQQQDVKMLARCIALDIDCAEACQFAAAVMGRGGGTAKTVCQMCAQICDVCAAGVRAPQADGALPRVRQACRLCAEECRRMAGTQ